MSIASSVHELHEVSKGLSAMELFRSGMNIGEMLWGPWLILLFSRLRDHPLHFFC